MNTTLAYSSTLILGALHALEPGHGKSFLASYMVGEKIKIKHVITLGASLLGAHFFLLTVIALAMRLIFSAQFAEQIQETISWAGPVIILAFGFYLLWKSRHHHHFEHGDACHHHPAGLKKNTSLKQTAIAGIIGGLLPCPSVIAPLLLSGAANTFHDAIFYILIYVAGMGAVLVSMVILFYLLKETLVRRLDSISSKINPHFISALLIITVGFVYLFIRIYAHEPHG